MQLDDLDFTYHLIFHLSHTQKRLQNKAVTVAYAEVELNIHREKKQGIKTVSTDQITHKGEFLEEMEAFIVY